MKKKILVTMQQCFFINSSNFFEELVNAGFETDTYIADTYATEEELISRMKGVNAIVSGFGGDEINERVLNSAKDLEVICAFGAGYNQIDVDAASRRGVLVSAASGVNATSTAELAFGLMLALSRRIIESNSMVKKGEYCSLMGNMISGKTLGVIGTGKIGKELARMAYMGFGMKILAYDVYKNKTLTDEYHAQYLTIEELLAESDYVSVHVPLTDSTKGLINRERLRNMKKSAYIINAARGGIVDEQALYTALKNHDIAGAGIDVYQTEPPHKDHPLLSLPNTITTAHIGGSSVEAIQAIGKTVVNCIKDAFLNKRNDFFINWDDNKCKKAN